MGALFAGLAMKSVSASRSQINVRASAARAVSQVLRGASLDNALLPAHRFRVPADAAMTRLLAFGVLRDLSLLQWLAGRMIDKPMAADDEIHTLLLVGLFQLRTLGTPPHAAINETVAAAELMKRPQAQGFINAVLRRYGRETDALEASIPNDPAIRYSHPAWLVDRLRVDWPDRWQDLLAANNLQGPLTLRVNRRRLSRDAYLQRLSEMQIGAGAVEAAPDAVTLAEARAVERIPGFNSGQVSVQDASAQFAADLLDLQPGQRVLDMCAAPGGKTAHLLERSDVQVTAVDRDPQRLIRVDENLQRLRLSAHLIAGDGGEPARWWDGKPFHRILLDAPCSGTGVIRRHPDIKWLRREADVNGLQGQQLRLLKSAWSLLKPGGRLLYATCSLLRAEGDEMIERLSLLADHVESLPIDAAWGEATAKGRRIAPGESRDGFYYALLRKTG
jgi:16S rRNA (cytosine967-C5)-methyltransferase